MVFPLPKDDENVLDDLEAADDSAELEAHTFEDLLEALEGDECVSMVGGDRELTEEERERLEEAKARAKEQANEAEQARHEDDIEGMLDTFDVEE